ncbi:hypothetical protein, partial [Micromonospora globispora]|uniref:hypothetical protein n=1 Tax=Micromonospora globispora TaxID=1450148 RepID=UPI001A9C3E57
MPKRAASRPAASAPASPPSTAPAAKSPYPAAGTRSTSSAYRTRTAISPLIARFDPALKTVIFHNTRSRRIHRTPSHASRHTP